MKKVLNLIVGLIFVVIATTRPELLPACVGMFYHPSDTRYKHLKGKMAKVPLFDIKVPIMEDERPDPEKGTGIVMCCTFGDMTDAEWQKAYKLPIKEAIGKDGKILFIDRKINAPTSAEDMAAKLEELGIPARQAS